MLPLVPAAGEGGNPERTSVAAGTGASNDWMYVSICAGVVRVAPAASAFAMSELPRKPSAYRSSRRPSVSAWNWPSPSMSITPPVAATVCALATDRLSKYAIELAPATELLMPMYVLTNVVDALIIDAVAKV